MVGNLELGDRSASTCPNMTYQIYLWLCQNKLIPRPKPWWNSRRQLTAPQKIFVRCSMRWLFHPLLLLLANSTEGELAKQVEFLKAENAMLRRRLPKWVQTTTEERSLLVKLGEAVGPGVIRL